MLTKIKIIGSGSFGKVYKCKDLKTGEFVALKEIDLDGDVDDCFDELRAEICTLMTCDHPNIIRYRGSYVPSISNESFGTLASPTMTNRLCIVMDYCEGGSLRQVLDRHGPLSENLVASIAESILKALEYLHRQGISHRDLKAANVLVDAGGRVKLGDFGVAFQPDGIEMGGENKLVGSPYWMAPEILSSSSSCGMCDSSAADIWSFGITLIELLKGRPPLHYLSPSGAMATIPRSSPPRLESDDSRVSKQLRGLIHACLHDDPHKRPTAAFLLKACKSYFKQQVYSVPGALARLCQDNSTNGNETDDCDSKEEVSSGSRKEAKEASDTIYSQWDFDMSTFMGEEVICENSLTGDSERTDEGSVNIGVDVSESEAIEPQEITEEEEDRNKIDTSESESFETKPSRSKFKFSRPQSHLNLFDRTAPGGWKDKDVSILPIPRPTDAPDLSRPQFLKVREENSQDSEIELLMREYLRGEKGPGVRMKLKGLL